MQHQQLAQSQHYNNRTCNNFLLFTYLQETRCLWTPFLFRTTMPSIQNAETYLQENNHDILNNL